MAITLSNAVRYETQNDQVARLQLLVDMESAGLHSKQLFSKTKNDKQFYGACLERNNSEACK